MADNSTSGSDGSGQKLGLTDQLRNQATSQLSSRKDRAIEGLSSLAEAARHVGQQLREKDQTGVASYVETAADQIERISHSVGNKDLTEIVDDVERFARRQPAVFLGVGFGLGLLGARFLKSSRPRTNTYGSGGGVSSGGYAATGGMYGQGAYGSTAGAGVATAQTPPAAEWSAGGTTPMPGSRSDAVRGVSDERSEPARLGSRRGSVGTSGGRTTDDRDLPAGAPSLDQ